VSSRSDHRPESDPAFYGEGNIGEFLAACARGDMASVGKIAARLTSIDARNSRGWTGLIVAAFNGRRDIIAELLKQGANVNACNAKGTTVFMFAKSAAQRTGSYDLLDFLLTQGADINAVDAAGLSVLDYVRRTGDQALVDYLLARGARGVGA
jgi:ankyrin repeat protein